MKPKNYETWTVAWLGYFGTVLKLVALALPVYSLFCYYAYILCFYLTCKMEAI